VEKTDHYPSNLPLQRGGFKPTPGSRRGITATHPFACLPDRQAPPKRGLGKIPDEPE